VADQVEAHIRLACDDGEDLQDWTPVEQERKVSSSRWGKVAVRGRAAVLGNFQAPMCRRVSEVQLKSVVGRRMSSGQGRLI
jgi:hypothetical protein